jgi:hypothetical protein
MIGNRARNRSRRPSQLAWFGASRVTAARMRRVLYDPAPLIQNLSQFATAIRLGALGYVLRETPPVEVATAIGAVAQGQAVCSSQYARVLVNYFASRSAV